MDLKKQGDFQICISVPLTWITETYLEASQLSTMKLFRKKAPSWMFESFLNTSLDDGIHKDNNDKLSGLISSRNQFSGTSLVTYISFLKNNSMLYICNQVFFHGVLRTMAYRSICTVV